MHRIHLALAATLALTVAACQDNGPAAPSQARTTRDAAGALVCSANVNDLIAQAQVIFGTGPNYNSVRGKLENLQHHLNNNNPAEAKDRAHDVVDFTLGKYREGVLSGSDAQLLTFLNGVYCLAGLEIQFTSLDGAGLIFPSDSAQTLLGLGNSAGISFPANPVGEPTLVTIESFTGRLNTKLDQYPGFIRITKQSENNLPLTSAVVISVCATGVPESVDLDDLRLGHGIRDTGFVITPRPDSTGPVLPNITCDTEAPALRVSQRIFNAIAAVIAPQPLHARSSLLRAARGGGVSGTVTEFSPFAPVDTKLESRGGVSGTVTEFIRSPMSSALIEGLASLSTEADCSEIPAGGTLSDACLPIVRVSTAQGTVLSNVPVDWTIPAASAGLIAPRTGDLGELTCGAFARSAATTTSVNGNAGVCWTLGGEGTYAVTARARVGGDAPAGVTFDNDGADSVHFSVQVSPVTIRIVSGDAQSAPAGSTLPLSPTVEVLLHGNPVTGVRVDWTALSNSDASVTPASSLTGYDGRTSATWTIGAGYNSLRAAVRNAPDTAVTFTANGSSGVEVINSCSVGNSSDPINDPSKPYAFWMPNPGGNTIREVDLYFSASGKANRPSDYRIALITRLGGFDQPVVDSTEVTVELRGNASEAKQATFRLRNPIVGERGGRAPAVTMQLRVLNNPDNATVRFNSGGCPPGGNCKVPRGCTVTEVSSPTPYPLGTFFRKTVGLTVRGN